MKIQSSKRNHMIAYALTKKIFKSTSIKIYYKVKICAEFYGDITIYMCGPI